MDFRIISPTAGLEKFATLSKTHLILAHIKDPGYQAFYKKRRELGDHIILDNGAHENGSAADWDVLSEAIEWYKPQVVVLPDTLNDPQTTASESLRFLDYCGSFHSDVEWMYVVQAKNGYIGETRLRSVLLDTRVGHLIKWLGITRYLTIDNQITRSTLKSYLDQYGLKLHALGMVNGSVSELKDLAAYGFDSVDSSVPVWRGWNDWKVGQNLWPEIPVDFSTKHPPISEQLIYQNLKPCMEAAGADTTELARRLSGA